MTVRQDGGGFSLPEDAHTHMRTHLEAFRVREVREERLNAVALFGRHNDHGRFAVQPGQRFKLPELRPVADLAADRPQIEGKRPGILRRQGDGGEGGRII